MLAYKLCFIVINVSRTEGKPFCTDSSMFTELFKCNLHENNLVIGFCWVRTCRPIRECFAPWYLSSVPLQSEPCCLCNVTRILISCWYLTIREFRFRLVLTSKALCWTTGNLLRFPGCVRQTEIAWYVNIEWHKLRCMVLISYLTLLVHLVHLLTDKTSCERSR